MIALLPIFIILAPIIVGISGWVRVKYLKDPRHIKMSLYITYGIISLQALIIIYVLLF